MATPMFSWNRLPGRRAAVRRGRTSRDNIRTGLIGTACLLAVMIGAMRFDDLPLVSSSTVYSAEFAEAAGLRGGDDVVVAGARVGKVETLELDGNRVRVGFSLADSDLSLGKRTEARIVTITLLGEAALELVPAGSGELSPDDPIPLQRTSSPYNITSALSDLTTEVQPIDLDSADQAMRAITETFEDTPAEVRSALVGLDEVATAVGSNDQSLQSLLRRAANVSGVLASRNDEIARLLGSGQSLLAELNQRHEVVVALLGNIEELSIQLRAVVKENGAVLGPALRELNLLTKQLNRNKSNLQAAIVGARNYAIGFGEAVSTGPFFDAYVQNLTSPATVGPVVSGLLR